MAMNYEDDREVTYEIVEEIGIIASQPTGWKKELNVVSWNGGQAKYDIREWSPKHDRMGRGITLNEQEMRTIVDLLKRRSRFVPRGVNTPQGSRDNMAQYGGSMSTSADVQADEEEDELEASAS